MPNRINRTTHLLGNVILAALLWLDAWSPIQNFWDRNEGDPLVTVLGIITLVAMSIFWILITVRRLHDFNWSGWWATAVILIPLLELMLLLRPGTKGSNKYGRSPKRGIQRLL